MEDGYILWQKRAKRNKLTPLWTAAAALLFTPLGYWFNGDGARGVKYTIIIFFAGYVTLATAAFLGTIVLTINVYNVSKRYEARFQREHTGVDYTKKGGMIKLALAVALTVAGLLSIQFFRRV
ncbi:MAG: hypothetical protein ACC644_03005 [Candidatus Hydrothermarchaeales archaeon]